MDVPEKLWGWIARGMLGLAHQCEEYALICEQIPAQAKIDLARALDKIRLLLQEK